MMDDPDVQTCHSYTGSWCRVPLALALAVGFLMVVVLRQHRMPVHTQHMQSTIVAAAVPDVFCFTVMGQPALERPLLLGQQGKGKGLFQCPAHVIFGQANDPPVTHAIPKLAFGVAKGGKWGTALNTPVFKEIWQKARGRLVKWWATYMGKNSLAVKSKSKKTVYDAQKCFFEDFSFCCQVQKMPEALAHSWIVKLDPDTVFLPERLGALLPSGSPRAFVVNCNEGLHGPIEVVSREALKLLGLVRGEGRRGLHPGV